MSHLVQRLSWTAGVLSMASYHLMTFTYKDENDDFRPQLEYDHRDEVMMEHGLKQQKLNSMMLCLLGMNNWVVKNRFAHFAAFSLLVNAVVFQSWTRYMVVINKDPIYRKSQEEINLIGDGCQVAGALLFIVAF